MSSRLRLQSFHFKESMNNSKHWEFQPFELESMTLIAGEPGQGKSRLLNVLRFLKAAHMNDVKLPAAGLSIEVKMTFEAENDKIDYSIDAGPDGQGQLRFLEKIEKNSSVLFDRKQNILHDEIKEEPFGHFYLPENICAPRGLKQPEFKTIGQIREFFSCMTFYEPARFNSKNIEVNQKPVPLNEAGSNLGSVLCHLKTADPGSYNEVCNEFADCFPGVVRDSILTQKVQLPGVKVPADVVIMRERSVSRPIPQFEWSETMIRGFCLLLLPRQQALGGNPSLICIDEPELGLDINTLSQILAYFKERQKQTPFMITTQSPLTCAMTEAKYWRVIQRKGSEVTLRPPNTDLDQLAGEQQQALKSLFELYQNHIAKPRLYRVN